MATLVFENRPAAEAVDYLERKAIGGRFSFDWRDVWQAEHRHSFVVAKAMTADLLTDIHAGLIRALKDGRTKEQFVAELTPLLQAKGWWGKKRQVDPLTGEMKLVTLGTPRRLRVIFDTNMRMAHAAGRWERFARSADTRPLLRYHHTPQLNPREWHKAWDKITLPITHTFWRTHYCPNGWGCKCFITSHRVNEAVTSEADLKARGVYDQVLWTNKRTGETTLVPKGIDKGFAYNVGQARMAAFVPPASPQPQRPYVMAPRDPRSLPPAPQPRALPEGVAVRPEIPAEPAAIFDALSGIIGKGEGEVFTDRAQVPLVLGRRMFEQHDAAGASTGPKRGLEGRARFAEVFAAVLMDPDEIWHSLQSRQDGTSVLVRNLVAAFDTGEAGRQWFVVSFSEGSNGGVWMGTTAFGPGKRDNPANQAASAAAYFRVGTLVYQRK